MRPFSIVSATAVFFCALFFSGDLARAQQSGDQGEPEHLVQQVIDIWSEHDPEKVDDVFTEDGIYEDVALGRVMRGGEEIKSWLQENFSAVPDFTVELTRIFSTKEMAACEWIMSGTHTGDYPELPATGKSFSVRGASVVLLEGEKIKHWTDYYNMYDFLQQLGAVPAATEEN